MRNVVIVILFFGFALFYSCSSESVKSSENYIERFEIPGYIGKPKSDQSLIDLFIFEADYENVLNAEPIIEWSKNAELLTTEGKRWTEEGFLYTVIAENGERRNYRVEIKIIRKKYSFEDWVLSDAETQSGYSIPSGFNSSWTSGNEGISMAIGLLEKHPENPKSYPTRDTTDIYGKAVLMETKEGGMVPFVNKNIPLFSGNFILGNFNISKIYLNELLATEVGQIYPAKPKSIKGYYKYIEGPEPFRDSSGTPYPGRNDFCSMNAIFYQSDSPSSGKDTILTVMDMDESELVIARASLQEQDCSQTTGDEFHEFEATFHYKSEPDFEKYNYKLGITFAASKFGDKYAGKIGTKLIIDEIEIVDYEE